jgi:hypothetical protein
MNINEKDLLTLIAIALSVGNGNENHFAKTSLHYFAIQVYKQCGFTREQIEGALSKI